jgi:hypothetical protein
MKGKRIVLTCTIAALTVSMGAMANEIYKWTDADGNVHYEDRPTGAATEVRLDLTYRSTDRSAVQRCERSRARLETYLQARRVYRTDENGERVYLDDTQRDEARRKAEEQIAEFCS